jgi:hypothetical protein
LLEHEMKHTPEPRIEGTADLVADRRRRTGVVGHSSRMMSLSARRVVNTATEP